MVDTPKPRVAVIGGGPAGLTSARHLRDIAQVTGFEYSPALGGLWVNPLENKDSKEA